MEIIDRAKEVFLTGPGVDEESYRENFEEIKSWESELVQHEALSEWQKHDITLNILRKFNQEYVSASMMLATGKQLTDSERVSLFAKKDACSLIFEIMNGDAKSQIKQLNREISQKISLFGS